jgi:hypothetical protein
MAARFAAESCGQLLISRFKSIAHCASSKLLHCSIICGTFNPLHFTQLCIERSTNHARRRPAKALASAIAFASTAERSSAVIEPKRPRSSSKTGPTSSEFLLRATGSATGSGRSLEILEGSVVRPPTSTDSKSGAAKAVGGSNPLPSAFLSCLFQRAFDDRSSGALSSSGILKDGPVAVLRTH